MGRVATTGLAGDCSITAAREHRGTLVAALEGSGPVELDVSGVTQADLSFVQLLAAAARTAARLGRSFRLVGVPEGLARAFQRSGIALDAATGRLLQI